MQWMIYGATGYTGQLVIEAALKRGHRPLLAGRNVDKLDALGKKYDLEYVAFRLEDVGIIGEAIGDMDVVYHAAGPFVHTSDPMIRACLATSTHYLDITGEISVFENTFSYDQAAQGNNIALISGVGYDVVPTDCLAAYVAAQIRGATHLEIGFAGFGGISAGTTKSMIEMMPEGNMLRRDGRLVASRMGKHTRTIPLPTGEYSAMAIPWGDLSTAYRTTGIPNITTYMAMPRGAILTAQLTSPVGQLLFRSKPMRQLAGSLADRFIEGPDETARDQGRAYIWAHVSNDSGQTASAWLTVPEPYQFTADVAIHAVEQTLALNPIGALSPAQAYGTDFVLQVAGVSRQDHL
jgi:short subunit dehydrogenase-like uncharacterized protein